MTNEQAQLLYDIDQAGGSIKYNGGPYVNSFGWVEQEEEG